MLNFEQILLAKKMYAAGESVSIGLRSATNTPLNSPTIIETMYDLQAGTYIAHYLDSPHKLNAYVAEMAEIIAPYLSTDCTILDAGTGELTTLSRLMAVIQNKPREVFAFDISWSRLYRGRRFYEDSTGGQALALSTFVADIAKIPFPSKSVDVVITSHALEPNGGNLINLLRELFRVTKKVLVLFEPCYEICTREGKERMDRLGYIKGMGEAVTQLKGKLLHRIEIKNIMNPLNPTAAYVIEPSNHIDDNKAFQGREGANSSQYSLPGENYLLSEVDGFLVSNDTGLCFPILKSIPLLRTSNAILASSLCS
jgi:SAM-dependent methyltransferase